MTTDSVDVAGADVLDKQLESLDIQDKESDGDVSNKGDGAKKDRKKTGKRFAKKSPRPYEERFRDWEDAQKKKEVIETGLTGTVKWYSIRGRYGFIARDDGKGDIFVHQSAISKSHTEKFYLRTLAEEQPVEFDLRKGAKGLEAGNVTGPDDTAVKDAKGFRHPGFRRYRKRLDGDKSGELKKKGDGEGDKEDGKVSDKPRRVRRRFMRKPKEGAEKSENEERPKRERRRREKSTGSDSKPDVEADAGSQKENDVKA